MSDVCRIFVPSFNNQTFNKMTKKIFKVTDRSGRSAKPYRLDGEHIKNTWDLEEQDDSTEQTLKDFLEECYFGEFWNTNDVRIECIEIQITSSSTPTKTSNSMTIEEVTKIWEFFQDNPEIDFGNSSYHFNDNIMIVGYACGVFITQELWDGQSGDMGEDLTLDDIPMNVLKVIYDRHSKE